MPNELFQIIEKLTNIYTIRKIIIVFDKEVKPTIKISKNESNIEMFDDPKFDYFWYTAWLYYRELYSRMYKLLDSTDKTFYKEYYNKLNIEYKNRVNKKFKEHSETKKKIFEKRNTYIAHTNYEYEKEDFKKLVFIINEVDLGIILIKEVKKCGLLF